MKDFLQDPWSEMSPTERRLLNTARSILASEGLSALTTRAVTTRSGENPAAIHYHFGSKKGLIRALLETHTFDMSVALIRQARSLPPGSELTNTWLDGMREIAEDEESFIAFFELLPLALRDPELSNRLDELYRWYRQLHIDVLNAEIYQEEVQALSALIVAVIDGLTIQSALRPDLDMHGTFELLKSLVRSRSHYR